MLEKKEDTPFSDDLLIPLYSQLFELSTKGANKKFWGAEKHLFVLSTLFANELPINRFLLGIEEHSSAFGCGSCTVKSVSIMFPLCFLFLRSILLIFRQSLLLWGRKECSMRTTSCSLSLHSRFGTSQ